MAVQLGRAFGQECGTGSMIPPFTSPFKAVQAWCHVGWEYSLLHCRPLHANSCLEERKERKTTSSSSCEG